MPGETKTGGGRASAPREDMRALATAGDAPPEGRPTGFHSHGFAIGGITIGIAWF